MKTTKARALHLGKLNGKPVLLVPVKVFLNDSQSDLVRTGGTIGIDRHEVVSHTPTDAANYVRDLYAERPETEVVAYGPNGGETYRYVGWESAIGHAMWYRPADRQMSLPLNADTQETYA